jgi:hypothetical protein
LGSYSLPMRVEGLTTEDEEHDGRDRKESKHERHDCQVLELLEVEDDAQTVLLQL